MIRFVLLMVLITPPQWQQELASWQSSGSQGSESGILSIRSGGEGADHRDGGEGADQWDAGEGADHRDAPTILAEFPSISFLHCLNSPNWRESTCKKLEIKYVFSCPGSSIPTLNICCQNCQQITGPKLFDPKLCKFIKTWKHPRCPLSPSFRVSFSTVGPSRKPRKWRVKWTRELSGLLCKHKWNYNILKI